MVCVHFWLLNHETRKIQLTYSLYISNNENVVFKQIWIKWNIWEKLKILLFFFFLLASINMYHHQLITEKKTTDNSWSILDVFKHKTTKNWQYRGEKIKPAISYSNAICLYRHIRLVTILDKILILPVVTKGFSWKDLPSWKCEIPHVIYTTMHKNT